MRRHACAIVAVICLSLVAGGCWDRRDPELLSLIVASGFDYDPITEEYIIIVQLANPLGMGEAPGGTGSSGGGTRLPYWVLTASGRTPFAALRRLEELSTRELFWAHSRVVVFGEELARLGVAPVMDLVERERQYRLASRVFVARGPLALLFSQQYPLEENAGDALTRQLESVQRNRGTIPQGTLRERFIQLSRPGLEMLLPAAEVQPGGEGANAPNPARLAGGGAFVGDRLVGWFDEDEVRGWQWAMGTLRRATLEVPLEGALVAVELFRTRTRQQVTVQDERVTVELDIRSEGQVQNVFGKEVRFTDWTINRLQASAALVVEELVLAAVARGKQLRSDVFGFGELVYRTHPREFEAMRADWPERLCEVEVKVGVTVLVRRTGLTGDPVEPGKAR